MGAEPSRGPRDDPVRIVSVPAGHPYSRAIRAAASTRFEVLADPDPRRTERLATQRFDLLHLHLGLGFGSEHRTAAELRELVDHLQDAGRPLVLTVHDLPDPAQTDACLLDRQLDVLVPAAAVVVTLTPWAAGRILSHWGREALVSPHPPVVPTRAAERLRERRAARPRRRPVVAMACSPWRADTDPVRLLPALDDAAHRHGLRIRLLVDRDIVHRPDRPERRRLVEALATAKTRGMEVVVHGPLTGHALWTELAGQDVAVLPHRYGTHSLRLEACHDVGTHVVAPAVGGYADQGADAVYVAGEDGVDADAFVDAIGELAGRTRAGRLAGESPQQRADRRTAAVRLHEQVYLELAGPSRAGGRTGHPAPVPAHPSLAP